MPVITEIEDLKRIYKRRVPKMFYDYAESGSWTEQTFRDNSSDFDDIRLRQRIAVDMDGRSTAAQMVGQDYKMPVALAPWGCAACNQRMVRSRRRKRRRNSAFPSRSRPVDLLDRGCRAEHEQPVLVSGLHLKDDDFMIRLFDRAKEAKCSALVITVDLQILGQRHRDIKNGLSAPPKLTPASILNLATKVPWGLEMLQTRRRSFGNVIGHAKGVSDPGSLASWTAEAFDPSLNWERIKEFRKRWDGPVILKGVLDEEDAKMAANVGADAIVVSNHGGRQLDGALSSIRMLPRIMDTVGDKIEVHLDSGIRSGQDVLKALALGAKGTMIGRAFVYGLGAMGEAGVTKALEVIHKELDTTMALCGERDVADLGRHNLLLPPGFETDWT
jgi:L-lactate dehydrogenase (cytochrome)